MKITAAMSIVIAMAASPVFADCTPPDTAMSMPNGAAATKDEMIAAQTKVRTLDAATQTYQDCLKQDLTAKVAAGDDKAKAQAQFVKLNNDAVMKLQEVANKFNEELRAYRAKSTPAQ